ncbi:MAG: DegQ family serine endoprotease [Nitrospirota bacterium]|nr:DegQ family serine endoprotease [Nitrospirota bacterium]
MKNKIIAGVAVLLLGFLLGGISYFFLEKFTDRQKQYIPYKEPLAPTQIIETGRSFAGIANAISPSVVNISTTKVVQKGSAPFFDDPFFDFFNPFRDFRAPKKWKEQSLGSGVIVSGDGYIITNNHVVEQADEIRVTLLDKRSFDARIIGADPKSDVAIVKIGAKDLQAIRWGDSDKLRVGEFVLAIGNPYRLSHTVTMGIISAVGRANVGIADYEDFIQTDAAINPGNSGGPLVNIKGELIGINTAIFSRSGGYQGIGFAVPSNMARLVMDQLIQEGKVTRGWLGVSIQELTPELSRKFGLRRSKGALVGDVVRGGPAEKAGIKSGDIILEFNGKKVKNVGNLRNMASECKVGSKVSITIFRDGTKSSRSVVISELPVETAGMLPETQPGESTFEELTGFIVIELSEESARQLGLNKNEKGVVVLRVEPGSSADEVGIRKGDVIQEIDRKKIDGLERFNEIVSGLQHGDIVLLYINRGGKNFYVTLGVS